VRERGGKNSHERKEGGKRQAPREKGGGEHRRSRKGGGAGRERETVAPMIAPPTMVAAPVVHQKCQQRPISTKETYKRDLYKPKENNKRESHYVYLSLL